MDCIYASIYTSVFKVYYINISQVQAYCGFAELTLVSEMQAQFNFLMFIRKIFNYWLWRKRVNETMILE